LALSAAELVSSASHLIELLRAHFVGSTWIGESLLARVTPVAIENEADMFGHKSGADLSTQSALIQPIEDVRHAKCVTGSRSGPDISDAVSRKKGDQSVNDWPWTGPGR
jgi:hypothetical protein